MTRTRNTAALGAVALIAIAAAPVAAHAAPSDAASVGGSVVSQAQRTAVVSGPNQAQALGDAQSAQDAGQVQDIVVTARKTSERLQSTPIAVTAIGADQIKVRSAVDLTDLSGVVPSLHATASVSGGSAPSFFIRGVGQADFLPTTDPGVGVYIDGIYLARTTGNLFDLADIKQIEVLRGPQGTLFGKNTEGGAISVTTKRPTGNLDGAVDATIGTDSRYDLRANVEFPIVDDKLAGSLTAVTRNQEGYGRSLTTGDRLGTKDLQGVRTSLNLLGAGGSSFYLSADYTHDTGTHQPDAIKAIYPSTTLAAYNSLVVAKTYPGQTFYEPRYITSDPLITYDDANDRNRSITGGVSGIGAIDLGSVTINSLTGYRAQHSLVETDTGAQPLPLFDTTRYIRQQQFTQEFQAVGKLFADRLSYVVGAFYEHEWSSLFTNQNYFPGFYAALKAVGAHPSDSTVLSTSTQKDDSYASFANGVLKLTDTLSLTAGVRYSSETKHIVEQADFKESGTSIFLSPAGTVLPTGTMLTAQRTFQSTTPTAGLQYQATNATFFYATFSKGFKSGGFDGRPITGATSPKSFDPEYVTNYEVGSKLDLLGRHVRLNTAFFWTDYDGLTVQVQVPQPGLLIAVNQIANAGNARIRGVEAEATVIPMAGLELTGNASFNDSKFITINAGAPFTLADHLQQAPKWIVNSSVAYKHRLGEYGSLSERVDYSYTSTVYNDLPNTFSYNAAGSAIVGIGTNYYASRQLGYSLINARVTFTSNNEKWTIAGFATNLTDKRYTTAGFASAAAGVATGYYAPPREGGVEVTRRF